MTNGPSQGTRLAFRPGISWAATRNEELLVVGESGHEVFEGPAYSRLALELDSSATVPELISRLAPKIPAIDLRAALHVLEVCGYVVPTNIHYEEPSESAKEVDVKLGISGVSLAIVDSYLDPRLRELVGSAVGAGQPWLPVRITGERVWVGPIIEPPLTPCLRCVCARVRTNHPAMGHLYEPTGNERVHVSRLVTPGLAEAALDLAHRMAAEWTQGRHAPDLQGFIHTIDRGFLTKLHEIVRLSNCDICGHALSPSTETAAVGSSPALDRHVSDICGIVRSLELVESASDHCQVYVAHHALAPALPGRPLRLAMHESFGRGLTDDQARTGAVCEALERISGVFRGDESRVRASAASLGEAAIHLNTCLLYSDRQLCSRNGHMSSGAPQPLGAETEIEWTTTRCLLTDQVRYVPTAYCYYEYPDTRHCRADSNGAAAGRTIAEAATQGFLELVERDAIAIWWYRRCRRASVDLRTIDSALVNELSAEAAGTNGRFIVYDLTTDLEIPTFAAVWVTSDGQASCGFGAHFSAEIALTRAVTELVQGRCVQRSGGRVPKIDMAAHQWLATPDVVSFREFRNQPFSDDAALRACVSRAARAGLKVLLLDMTRPDIGLPTVRIIVPGLRAPWRRLGGGRLYSVPEILGCEASPTGEDYVNAQDLFP